MSKWQLYFMAFVLIFAAVFFGNVYFRQQANHQAAVIAMRSDPTIAPRPKQPIQVLTIIEAARRHSLTTWTTGDAPPELVACYLQPGQPYTVYKQEVLSAKIFSWIRTSTGCYGWIIEPD